MVKMVKKLSRRQHLALLLAMGLALPAQAAPLVGRVFDSVQGEIHAKAEIRIAGFAGAVHTDGLGFFRCVELMAGAHRVSIVLADGRFLSSQVLILPGRETMFAEFDVSRIIPPDDDDDY